ncbi:uncharacterized protein LOC115472519 [Microcaecilia unicolor]|uniref:Uncharacterized protein LOC115472519 n=1 Tax=Microcaecilia unicolor TaxID=1415580 RepID=A0A6P7YC95_9AMPH|nr:uncharacterized protein LOC115472519 [Microcaecilia unicolor]
MHTRTWIAMVLTTLLMGSLSKMIEPGPMSGVVLQDTPGFLIAQSQIVTQKVVVSLDPMHVILRHFNVTILGKSLSTQTWFFNYMQYARDQVKNILAQLEKVMVQPVQPQNARSKRFVGIVGGLIFSALGSLFGASMSVANAISVRQLQATIKSLEADLKNVESKLHSQQNQLIAQGKTIADTVTLVNLHTRQIEINTMDLSVLKGAVNEERLFIHPVKDLMQDLFRELDTSVSNLMLGHIPTYLVPSAVIREAFAKITRLPIEPFQIQTAFHLGMALPLMLDMERMEIAFLLQLPFIGPENVYQLKQVLNVGTWHDNLYLHVETPQYVAYQQEDPQHYLVPNLDLCQKAKDIHWLCPGKPFLKDSTEALCGLSTEKVQEKCKVQVSKYEDFSETTVAVVDTVWMISTPNMELTVTFLKHDVINRFSLPCNVCLIAVPKYSVVNVGGVSLFYLDTDSVISELEILDVFRGHPIDFALDVMPFLQSKNSHTVELAVNQDSIQISDYKHHPSDVPVGNITTHVAIPLLTILWIVMFVIVTLLAREVLAQRQLIRRSSSPMSMRLRDFV